MTENPRLLSDDEISNTLNVPHNDWLDDARLIAKAQDAKSFEAGKKAGYISAFVDGGNDEYKRLAGKASVKIPTIEQISGVIDTHTYGAGRASYNIAWIDCKDLATAIQALMKGKE